MKDEVMIPFDFDKDTLTIRLMQELCYSIACGKGKKYIPKSELEREERKAMECFLDRVKLAG